jgi:hypothetical protein
VTGECAYQPAVRARHGRRHAPCARLSMRSWLAGLKACQQGDVGGSVPGLQAVPATEHQRSWLVLNVARYEQDRRTNGARHIRDIQPTRESASETARDNKLCQYKETVFTRPPLPA